MSVPANDAKGTKTGTLKDHPGEGTDEEAKKLTSEVVEASKNVGVETEEPDSGSAKHVTLVHHATVLVEVSLNSL